MGTSVSPQEIFSYRYRGHTAGGQVDALPIHSPLPLPQHHIQHHHQAESECEKYSSNV